MQPIRSRLDWRENNGLRINRLSNNGRTILEHRVAFIGDYNWSGYSDTARDNMTKKIKVFKITRPSLGKQWCISEFAYAVEELQMSMENDEVGDSVCFEMVEMTEEELHALPDFGGW